MELGETDSHVPTLIDDASECEVAVCWGNVDDPYDTGSMWSSFLVKALPRTPPSK